MMPKRPQLSMELSAKPFLELEEKLELKKYNLATHYGPQQDHP